MRFPALRATAQERAQTWSYILLTVYQLGFAATAWAGAWRWGAAGIAVLLAGHGVHVLRWRAFPDPQTEPAPAGDRAWWDVLRIPAALLTILALTLGVVAFQLLFSQLQAHLVDVGLTGGAASVVVASLGTARLVSVPFMRHYGTLADQRTPLASLLASRWIAASGLLAAATLLPVGNWGAAAIVLATATVSCATIALEIGQNSQTTATRGYLSALSLDATTIVTVAVAGSSYLGGQLAALLPWRAIVGGWVLIGLTVYVLSVAMRRAPLRDTHWRVYPPAGDALTFTLLPPERGVLQLELSGPDDLPVCDLREGDRIVADGPYDRKRSRSPRVTEFRVHVHWERHPARVVHHDGQLRRLRRFPLVATDGSVYGYGRWFGLPGTWRVVAEGDEAQRWYRLELRSPTLRGALTLRHKSLHR
jgi:hypothetical protein